MYNKLTKYTAWTLYFLIIALYGFSFWALFNQNSEPTFWSWLDIFPILGYSLLQAGLSALLSVILGILLARSFFYLHFKGKHFLYKIISFMWALPSLVVIFAIIGVFGYSGWLAQLLTYFGISWQPSIYGLQGILLAHLFFNMPLVTKYCLEGLTLIPASHHKLAAQLNLQGWHYFRVVELPSLKRVLPYSFLNVFLICFTSFPIVLMLGGGPKYSTLEVAIYQAVSFEFDFAKAVILIMVQLAVGLLLQFCFDLSTHHAFSVSTSITNLSTTWKPLPQKYAKRGLLAILLLLSTFILAPLLNIIWQGISVPNLSEKILSPTLWSATFYSIILSLIASVSVIILAYFIALETRKLAYRQHKIRQYILAGVTTYPLILPIFLLAVGLFLLFIDIHLTHFHLLLLVGICNGLTLLPYIYRLIFSAMWQAFVAHDKLAQSLGLNGIRRWWIVERPYLWRPLRNAFALAMSASLGSFAVIAFFGSPDFSTLPYLLYQQLGSYRMDEAAVSALWLMLLALLPFLFIEQQENK